MKSIQSKRKQSSWIIMILGTSGIIFGRSFNDIPYDTMLVWSAIMVLAMLTGIIGILED